MLIDKFVWSKLWRTACRQTETRQTHGRRRDKSAKTEGPKILSNYIFYFKTVIIGGPIKQVQLRVAVEYYISREDLLKVSPN